MSYSFASSQKYITRHIPTFTTTALSIVLAHVISLCVSAPNQMMLGKDGCVATLATILSSVPKTHWAKTKFIMEVLALLTKASKPLPHLVLYVMSIIPTCLAFSFYPGLMSSAEEDLQADAKK